MDGGTASQPLVVDPEDEGKPASARFIDGEQIGAALALVNAALGAGVLAYPFAFMSAGIIPASLFTLFIGLLSFMALCFIMHSMKVARERRPSVASFGELVHCALGPRASAVLEGPEGSKNGKVKNLDPARLTSEPIHL